MYARTGVVGRGEWQRRLAGQIMQQQSHRSKVADKVGKDASHSFCPSSICALNKIPCKCSVDGIGCAHVCVIQLRRFSMYLNTVYRVTVFKSAKVGSHNVEIFTIVYTICTHTYTCIP